MRGCDFIFDSVQILCCKCYKISFKCGQSYIDSPDWIKNKKTTINLKNDSYNFFQNAITIALNIGEIKKDPGVVSNIKPFINNSNRERINYPSICKDWKRFEKNNPTILLNLSCSYFKF